MFIVRFEYYTLKAKWIFFSEKVKKTVYISMIEENGLKIFEITKDKSNAFVFKNHKDYLPVVTPLLMLYGGKCFKESINDNMV